MVCEWVFADALSGGSTAEPFAAFLRTLGHAEHDIAQWLEVRAAASGFLDQCLERICWDDYAVVGFSTTMIQTLASLALARRLKERHPEMKIVFGGANCEDEMGAALLENFSFIDVVVRRECDGFVSDLFARLLDERPLDGLPVCQRTEGRAVIGPQPPIFTRLNDLPYPDYDDYFTQLDTRPFAEQIRVNIVFESSRGCWYGEKHQCTFCGLNGGTIGFRVKSAGRLADELAHLSSRHGVKWFGAADNILDHKQQMEICRQLRERVPGAKLFFDVKSNMARKQLVALKQAGIDEVQPGIESLSSRVLRLMKKGVTGIANVHFLRMCLEVGIWPMWNYLYGFPGETVDDYAPLLDWISPALFHLPAPYVGFGLSLQRFSPYFEQPEEYGLIRKGPLPHYRYIYDLPWAEVDRLAYYFDFAYRDGYDPSVVGRMVDRTASDWSRSYYVEKRSLLASLEGDGVTIRDTRFGGERIHRLDGAVAELYRQMERPRPLRKIVEELRSGNTADYVRLRGAAGVAATVERLHSAKLVYREDELYIALAAPVDPVRFWHLDSTLESDGENMLRPLPALLHWKVEHLHC